MYTSGFGFFQSTKTYSLNEFGVMADEFKRAYFKCIPNVSVLVSLFISR